MISAQAYNYWTRESAVILFVMDYGASRKPTTLALVGPADFSTKFVNEETFSKCYC